MKTIWIVSGGAEAVPGIKRAKKMGLHVVVSDGNPQAPGFVLADDRVVASTYDIEATVAEAQKYRQSIGPIDGVISIAADVPLTVATVAADLGLPGISIESARLASNKLDMKEKFSAAGVPIPEFREVRSSSEIGMLAKEWGYPLVIKPVDSRGSRGVLRITTGIDFDWAFGCAMALSAEKRVIAERFIEGMQISTESMVYKGHCFTAAWSERNYEFLDRFAPYIIENGGDLPARLSAKDIAAVEEVVGRAAASLGIENGPVKGDIVLDKAGPKVIELAARLSGGYFCTDQIPLATGVDLVTQTIKLALGESLDESDLIPRELCSTSIRYFFPDPGRIIAITGFDELERCDWIAKKMIFLRVGDIVEQVTDHTKRAGFVLVVGKTRNEARERAVSAVDAVKIQTVPA